MPIWENTKEYCECGAYLSTTIEFTSGECNSCFDWRMTEWENQLHAPAVLDVPPKHPSELF